MKLYPSLSLLVLIALTAPAVLAGAPSAASPSSMVSASGLPGQGPLEGGDEEESQLLQNALDAVVAENIKADLRFIASDELAGRDTPSPGLKKAARYIRARLQRLGFTPGGLDGDFFHYYKMVRSKLDSEATRLTLKSDGETAELEFGEGYYFWPNGVTALQVTGEVVFTGQAHAADVAGLDLGGRWAFCFDSEIAWREREENCRERGAIGVIVASHPDDEDAHSERRAQGIARWASRGGLRVVTGATDEGGIFPTVYVSRATAERLMASRDKRVGDALDVTVTDLRALADGSEEMVLENVCGLWPGSDPELSKEVLIVSAHYDHVGENGDEIFNGADDNGSGTVGLMAIAEALAAHGPMERSVLLLWVSGEEKGLKGSEAWTLDPTLPEGMRPVANLNIDMIGRNAPNYLLITPTVDHPAYNGLTRMAERTAPLEGFPKLGSCDEYWERSDHRNFSVNLEIPVAFLFTDVHEDYHQSTDTVEKIDYDKIARVSRVVVRMLDHLQDMDVAQLQSDG